jgi:hypothetical protein
MKIKVSKGDYFIAKREGGKDYLAKALSDNDAKSVESVLEKNCHIQGQRHTMTVELSDIILNLGPKPHAGKVYGQDVVALHRKRADHDVFGDIHFFYAPEKTVLVDLKDSMNKVAAKFKKTGLNFLFKDVVYEVMPYNGEKYAGQYMKGKNEKIPDRIQIRPEIMPASEYAYVWYHEFGHRMHLRFCPSKKLNATWLKLYSTSIKVESVRKDKSQQLLDMLMDGEEAPSNFKSGLDEEDALAFKWIVRTIQQVNGLSIKDLDTLFEAEMKEEIRKVWPVRNIPRKELAPIVSEYATVNVKELFAECFAFYMVGKKLPEPIVKLLEKSIAYAKANHDKADDE